MVYLCGTVVSKDLLAFISLDLGNRKVQLVECKSPRSEMKRMHLMSCSYIATIMDDWYTKLPLDFWSSEKQKPWQFQNTFSC